MLPHTRQGKKKGSRGWAGKPGVAWHSPPGGAGARGQEPPHSRGPPLPLPLPPPAPAHGRRPGEPGPPPLPLTTRPAPSSPARSPDPSRPLSPAPRSVAAEEGRGDGAHVRESGAGSHLNLLKKNHLASFLPLLCTLVSTLTLTVFTEVLQNLCFTKSSRFLRRLL